MRTPGLRCFLCLIAAVILWGFGCGAGGLGLGLGGEVAPELPASVHAPAAIQPTAFVVPGARRPLSPDTAPQVSTILREFVARDEHSVVDLAALLDSTTASSVRRSAAQLLAEMGTPSAVAALLNAIATAPRGEPPADLLAALDSLANPEAAPALAAFLLQTSEPAVLAPVRDALARIADAPGVLEIVMTLHESAFERWQYANLVGALHSVRSPAAVPVLREVLLRDSDLALRGQAALVLGYIGGPESAEALATALASSRSSAFTAAVTESLALLRARALKGPSQPDDPP